MNKNGYNNESCSPNSVFNRFTALQEGVLKIRTGNNFMMNRNVSVNWSFKDEKCESIDVFLCESDKLYRKLWWETFVW